MPLAAISQVILLLACGLPCTLGQAWPQGADLLRQRNTQAEQRLHDETPALMRKMPDDASQMFHLEYWGFEHDGLEEPSRNSSSSVAYQPPFLVHGDYAPSSAHRYLSRLFRRDFSCPDSTDSCASIGRPNTCCANGLTCSSIQNTGLGDVGCCAGSSCSGQVSQCPSGYTTCPGTSGGGCCIPGYECNGDIGCIKASTTTVMVQTLVIVTPTTSTTAAPSTTSTSPPPPTTTSSPPPPPPSSDVVNPPVRATSLTSAAVTTTVASTVLATPCPSGFYQCAAFFNGGSCCRVGRDCATASCPARDATDVLVSNGVTIFGAPTGAPPDGQQGACANGWYSCGADVGGGCCLSGFACGTASCTATDGRQPSVSPIAKANMATAQHGLWALWWGLCLSLAGFAFL